MRVEEVVERLHEARAWVEEIDLRGRKRGTPVHTAVTDARRTLQEALDALEEES